MTQFKDSLEVYKELTEGSEECEFGVKVFESIGKIQVIHLEVQLFPADRLHSLFLYFKLQEL